MYTWDIIDAIQWCPMYGKITQLEVSTTKIVLLNKLFLTYPTGLMKYILKNISISVIVSLNILINVR